MNLQESYFEINEMSSSKYAPKNMSIYQHDVALK